jgi:tRNA acetyltransferase TAN1
MVTAGKRGMNLDRASVQALKRRKGGDKWQKLQSRQQRRAIIESGDSGIFLTCDMGREGKCVAEALDLFSQYNTDTCGVDEESPAAGELEDDIEDQIKREMEGLKPKSTSSPFQAVQLDTPCLTFIRTDNSIDPVRLVHGLCAQAQSSPEQKRSRWIRRMTPITSIRKTLSADLEQFAMEILKPYFHSGGPPKKYAIRPTIRSNEKFKRDTVIATVADVVGREHKVDLKNYDLIILVDVFQNIIGMSVVGGDYDRLKRFNLAELYSPAPKKRVIEVVEESEPPRQE